MSSPQAHHYHMNFSGQLIKVVLTVVAGMLFKPSLLLLVIHDGFCFFVSDLPLLLIQSPFLCRSVHFLVSRDVEVCLDPLEHCLSSGILQHRHDTGKDVEFLVWGWLDSACITDGASEHLTTLLCMASRCSTNIVAAVFKAWA